MLHDNRISDLEPLVLNTGLDRGDRVVVRGNPLSAASRTSYIPGLTSRGVTVRFDTLSVASLKIFSGDGQTGTAGNTLANPFVVKVRSANDTTYAYRNLPVTFSVAAGGGRLSATSDTTDANGLAPTLSDTTDANGLARIWLTLGATVGMNTVKAFVEEAEAEASDRDTLIFTTLSPMFVTIPDTSLHAAILERLVADSVKSASDTPITDADMLGLTYLNAGSKKISNLTGLESATNLTFLSLYGNFAIKDIDSLSGLTRLIHLDLVKNDVANISPLSGLTRLKRLYFSENKVEDISPLSRLTRLTTLVLRKNNVANISPLSGLDSLTALVLSDNNVEDISPLSRLTRLTHLELNGNRISDLEPLKDNMELDRGDLVFVRGNPLSALSRTSYIPALTGRGVTVVFDPLRPVTIADDSLRAVIERSLSDTTITNADMLRLTRLDAPNKGISNLAGLEFATQLDTLDLGNNRISNIDSLAGLTRLKKLSLGGNHIADIDALALLTDLTWLWLSYNVIEDISPLEYLTDLTWLGLGDNRIANISSLSGLTHLTRLGLSNNRISNLQPLMANRGLGRGDHVDVRGNPLSAASRTTHISALTDTSRGVKVTFDSLTSLSLKKVSGDGQIGKVGTPLPNPFVVKVEDQNERGYAGLLVTFQVTAGGGKFSTLTDTTTTVLTDTTDATGQAETTLILGATANTHRVSVSAEGVSQPLPLTFTATLPTPDFDGNGRVNFADFLALANKMGSSRDRGSYEAKYDLDGDGVIGMGDFRILASRFGDGKSDDSK